MKLSTETRDVTRFGTGTETAFKIAGTAKAFRALSKTVYSDGALAVVRELACNAFDAHIAAGNSDTPIEVHLPNKLEPWFSVTDYGTGLCEKDIRNLYSTYFESTKTDTNDQTGCFGIGSKAPFAYGDVFTVESRWNGKLTVYSCFKDEEDLPKVVSLGEPMDTTEHNGLTVKIAVKESDFGKFADRAMRALNRFNPTPKVTGNTSYMIETVEYAVEGTNWKMIKDGQTSSWRSNICAIQGGVTYPISSDSMSDVNLTSAQKAVMTLPIDIFFDIGEVDPALSREALEYTKTTVANIRDALDRIADELPPLYQDQFDKCATLWDARVLFHELIRGLPHGIRTLLSDKDVGLKWKKQPLDEEFIFESKDFPQQIVLFERGTRGHRGHRVDPDWQGKYKFSPSNHMAFFYDDVGHGSHSRVSHFIDTDSNAPKKNFLFKTHEKKVLKALSKALGNVVLQPVSNLPKRPKAVRAAARVTSKVLEYVGKAHDRRDSWNPTEVDLKQDSGVYVVINRFKIFNKASNSEVSNFDEIVDLAKENNLLDLGGKPIYGIRSGDVAKLPDNTKWVNLFDLIHDNIKEIAEKENIADILADCTAFSNFSFGLDQFKSSLMAETFDADSPLGKFLAAYKHMQGRRNDRALAIRNVGNKVNYRITETKPTHDLEALWEDVKNRYPLINHLDMHSLRGGYYSDSEVRKTNFQSVMAYIKLVDNETNAAKVATPD